MIGAGGLTNAWQGRAGQGVDEDPRTLGSSLPPSGRAAGLPAPRRASVYLSPSFQFPWSHPAAHRAREEGGGCCSFVKCIPQPGWVGSGRTRGRVGGVVAQGTPTLLRHVYIPSFIEEFGSRGQGRGTQEVVGCGYHGDRLSALRPLVGQGRAGQGGAGQGRAGRGVGLVSVSPVTFYEGAADHRRPPDQKGHPLPAPSTRFFSNRDQSGPHMCLNWGP